MRIRQALFTTAALALTVLSGSAAVAQARDPLAPTARWSANTDGRAATPPMGWNSWNAYHCDINETDTFTFNEKFTHEKYRLKVNQVQLKETKEENKATHERVAEDRGFECQAAVVSLRYHQASVLILC